MSKLVDCSAVKYQMNLIKKELEDVSPLFAVIAQRDPDSIEIRAIGSVFQTFYNGAESVIELLLGQQSSHSSDWHRRLLETAHERNVISEDLLSQLDQFRRFRHKYRHSYGFTLNWAMMNPLYAVLHTTYSHLQSIVQKYCPD